MKVHEPEPHEETPHDTIDRDGGFEVARCTLADASKVHPVPDSVFGAGSTDLHPPPHPLLTLQVSALFQGHTDQAMHRSFADVLAGRRSRRTFAPLPAADLFTVLRQVFGLQWFEPADDDGIRRFRPTPSAGARHPLMPLLLIHDVPGLAAGLWRYDPDADLLYLVAEDPLPLSSLWNGLTAAGDFAQRPPAVVVLAARFDATLARYPDGTSLVWRDAGVALGYLHLAATSQGLNSCILGTSGLVSDALLASSGVSGRLVGDLGAVAVGGG